MSNMQKTFSKYYFRCTDALMDKLATACVMEMGKSMITQHCNHEWLVDLLKTWMHSNAQSSTSKQPHLILSPK